jgi:hypothetical protein
LRGSYQGKPTQRGAITFRQGGRNKKAPGEGINQEVGEKEVMTKVPEAVMPYSLISESFEKFKRPTVESPETNQAGGATDAQRGIEVRGFWAKGSVIRDMPPPIIINIKYLFRSTLLF